MKKILFALIIVQLTFLCLNAIYVYFEVWKTEFGGAPSVFFCDTMINLPFKIELFLCLLSVISLILPFILSKIIKKRNTYLLLFSLSILISVTLFWNSNNFITITNDNVCLKNKTIFWYNLGTYRTISIADKKTTCEDVYNFKKNIISSRISISTKNGVKHINIDTFEVTSFFDPFNLYTVN